MSFEESIIIPLSVYKRCRMDRVDERTNVLADESLPTDAKMKLYQQEQTRERLRKKYKASRHPRPSSPPSSSSTPLPPSSFGEHIVVSLPIADRPQVKAILDFFKDHPSVLSWNNNNEVLLGGKLLPGSDIVDVFRYFSGNLPVTMSADEPIGIRDIYDALISLGLPQKWIKKKPPAKRPQRRPRIQSTPFATPAMNLLEHSAFLSPVSSSSGNKKRRKKNKGGKKQKRNEQQEEINDSIEQLELDNTLNSWATG